MPNVFSAYLDEKILLFAPRTEPLLRTHWLDFDFAHSRQQMATITAAKNIKPSMQKANANFDVDIQSVPSDGSGRTREDSSVRVKTGQIWWNKVVKSNTNSIEFLPEALYRLSDRRRSSSICGAVTANELNTSIRANCLSASSEKDSSERQLTFSKYKKRQMILLIVKTHWNAHKLTFGHPPLHSWTPQLTCNRSRSGNLKAGNVAVNSFSTKSSACGFDQPSSAGRRRVRRAGITFKKKKKQTNISRLENIIHSIQR